VDGQRFVKGLYVDMVMFWRVGGNSLGTCNENLTRVSAFLSDNNRFTLVPFRLTSAYGLKGLAPACPGDRP
jgi:hypothetical protein